MRLGRRLLRGAGLMAPPLVAALVVGARLIPGGTLWPWHPGGMMDLEVYQRTGRLVLAGADFFHVAADQLPWIYPPFAALLSVGLAWLPFDVAAAAWLAGCVLALALLLRRCGFHGWPLSAAATVCVLFVEPVRETLGFGQMGVFLVALACLDSLPRMRARFGRSKAGGPGGLSPASPTLPPVDASRRESGPGGRGGVSSPETVGRAVQRSGGTSGFRTVRVRRREGWLTGLATAVKLTPALLAVYEFFSGRRRVGVVAFCSFLVCTALGFALWQPSLYYWAALATGNSGVNDRIQFATNQTVMGVWTRLSGSPSAIALALSVALIVLGLVGAIRVGRRFPALGFCLAGLTSLLGSPVSWSHHYVWVVPLALALWDAPVAGGEAASPSGGGLADGSPRSAAWASPGGAGAGPGRALAGVVAWWRRPSGGSGGESANALPGWFRNLGLVYCAWVVVGPFQVLPRDNGVEFAYNWWQHALSSVGVGIGVIFLLTTLFVPLEVIRKSAPTVAALHTSIGSAKPSKLALALASVVSVVAAGRRLAASSGAPTCHQHEGDPPGCDPPPIAHPRDGNDLRITSLRKMSVAPFTVEP